MTYQHNNLCSTESIIVDEKYSKSEAFFGSLLDTMYASEFQIAKIETRQAYQEPGNKSYELFFENKGSLADAVKLLPEIKESDKQLYEVISQKGVEFVRCRPILLPLSKYLEWELENYHFNSLYAEKIFLCDLKDNFVKSIFHNYILHDFMIIDNVRAFIHDYDESGRIRGGWEIENAKKIQELLTLFSLCKSKSLEWKHFIKENSIELLSENFDR